MSITIDQYLGKKVAQDSEQKKGEDVFEGIQKIAECKRYVSSAEKEVKYAVKLLLQTKNDFSKINHTSGVQEIEKMMSSFLASLRGYWMM